MAYLPAVFANDTGGLQPSANRFLAYWGRRHFSQVTHFDFTRKFILNMGERDLSSEIVHRYLWALRSFFDFLCMNGIADKSAPRLVRSRPTKRPLPRALSRQNVQRLLKATDNVRDRALLEVYYSTGSGLARLSVFAWNMWISLSTPFLSVVNRATDVCFSAGRPKNGCLSILAGRRSGYLFESQHLIQHGCVSWNGKGWVGYWLDYKRFKARAGSGQNILGVKKRWRAPTPGDDSEDLFQILTKDIRARSLTRLLDLAFPKFLEKLHFELAWATLLHTIFAIRSRLTCLITGPTFGTCKTPGPRFSRKHQPIRAYRIRTD